MAIFLQVSALSVEGDVNSMRANLQFQRPIGGPTDDIAFLLDHRLLLPVHLNNSCQIACKNNQVAFL